MRILVDTHILLWWLGGRPVPAKGRAMISSPENRLFVSAASVWEVAIKSRLGRLEVDPRAFLSALATGGFEELSVTARHAAGVAELPDHHRDPFDRLLISQSLLESMRLLTHDRSLSEYGDAVVVV
ncbi:MAG: type II toxin-antitoxin system VapC family toxin [Burkholderiales bacterium]